MSKSQKDPQVWLDNLAKTMINQLKMGNCHGFDSPVIANMYGRRIKEAVLKMTSATRGEIADLAESEWTRYREVGVVGMEGTGREILTYTAVRTIIARMSKILCNNKTPSVLLCGRAPEWPRAWSHP